MAQDPQNEVDQKKLLDQYEKEKKEREIAEQEEYEKKIQHDASSGFVAPIAGVGGVANYFFGQASNLEADRGYQRVVRDTIANDPSLANFKGKLFVEGDNGYPQINPELLEKSPSLKDQADDAFSQKHPERFKQYQEKERIRIYKDHTKDPAYIRLQKEIDRQTMAKSWAQGTAIKTPGTPPQKQSYDQTRDEQEQEQTRNFARQHPEKARMYANRDPKMKRAFEEWKEEEWQKKSKWRKRFDRYQNPHLVPESQRKAWMPKHLRRVSDAYDAKKQAVSSRITGRYEKSLLGRSIKRIDAFSDRLLNPIYKISDSIESFVAKGARKAASYASKPLGAGKKLLGKLFKNLATKFPGIAGLISRGAIALRKVIQGVFRASGKAILRAGSEVTKMVIREGLKVAVRLVAGFLATTAPVWLPVAAAGAVIGIVLIVIIVVILQTLGVDFGTGESEEEGQLTIAQDVEQTQVANAPPCEPNIPCYIPGLAEPLGVSTSSAVDPSVLQAQDSLIEDFQKKLEEDFQKKLEEAVITYKVTVSYNRGADDIIVRYPIDPEKAYFVRASGRYTEEKSGNVVSTIVWSVRENQIGTQSADINKNAAEAARNSSNFSYSTFSQYGFPEPQSPNPAAMQGATLSRYKDFSAANVAKAASLVGVDPGFVGAWPYLENQFSTYMDNCADSERNPNTFCPGWGGQWQVGLGNHPAYMGVRFIKEAFEQMYGSSSNETVRSVGQKVIDQSRNQAKYPAGSSVVPFIPITAPSTTFPTKSIDEIVNGANAGNQNDRMYLGILMKDEAIGLYLIAKNFKGLADSHGENLASVMNGWTAGGYYSPQKVINHIAAVYDAGLEGGGGSTGGSFAPQTFTITLLPKDPNQYFESSAAFAQVIGARGGSGSSSDSGSGQGPIPGAIDLNSVQKSLLPLPPNGVCEHTATHTCGRSTIQKMPYKIVMHTTWGITDADMLYNFFASGATGRGVGSHYMIGTNGKIIQMVEMGNTTIDYAQATGSLQNHISIEMGSPNPGGNYENVSQMNPNQYRAALGLVKALMNKYNIPLGPIECQETYLTRGGIDDQIKGVFGHYQFPPKWAGDPGQGWFCEFRQALRSAVNSPNVSPTVSLEGE